MCFSARSVPFPTRKRANRALFVIPSARCPATSPGVRWPMSSWGTPAIVIVFVAAGIATWIAGLYLSKATDVLDDRLRLGDAVGGMLLLGLAGSLPELAIVSSA